MAAFKKLNTKIYQKSGPVITPDYIYWKGLGEPVLVKEFGPIDHIDFSPIPPYYFAVTCSVRVQVYNPITKLVVKNISRFRENAHGAVFRGDGKLLCAGGDEGAVKLFDVSTKSMLRLFKGHESAVHRTHFIHGKPQIASFSDDKSVKVWDIATENNILTYSEHSDYVRAGAVNVNVPDVVLSGGYDSIVKMYDMRSEKSVITVNHGSPVESLLFLPSGGIFLSAGGTAIKVWDALAGGKLLGTISQHHKTITCLKLASDNKRLLSGSLDRHVKIYDVSTFKVVHTLDYPNAVLSLGVSKSDDTVVAGLVDGLICVNRRKEEITEKKHKFERYNKFNKDSQKLDVVVPDEEQEKLSKFDMYFKKFAYLKALESVLLPYIINRHPERTVAVLRELEAKEALHRVFQQIQTDTKAMLQLLKFFTRNISNLKFTKVLITVVDVFIDVNQDSIYSMPVEVVQLFNNLNQVFNDEVKLINELACLQGAMEMLIVASDTTESKVVELKNLKPSEDAQENIVYSVS